MSNREANNERMGWVFPRKKMQGKYEKSFTAILNLYETRPNWFYK